MFVFLWFLIASFFIALLIFPYVLSFLESSELVRENFRGKIIPTSAGIIIVLAYLATLGLSVFLNSLLSLNNLGDYNSFLYPLSLLVVGVAFFGLIDDFLREGKAKGFRGHFKKLSEGILTSGTLKALGIGFVSLYVSSFFAKNVVSLALDTLLLALTVNLFNLLDLRPGRTLKVFFLAGVVLFLFSEGKDVWPVWGIFLGVFPLLLLADLKERCMLGDSGSNVLGAVVGFTLIVNFSFFVKLIMLILVVLLELSSEKYSFTEIILKFRPLRWFDELGRKPD